MLRVEARSKLTGREVFIDDLPAEDIWWAGTVRSSLPRGRIRDIHFGSGIDWSSLIVVDHRDIPGPNEVQMIERDMPVLAADVVRHVHEPIVLLAHPSRRIVRQAVQAISVTIDPDEPMLDFRHPPTPQQIQYGSDNVFKKLKIEKGTVDEALAAAPIVVEGEYETGAQEHVYIEPQGMQAQVENDVLVVKGSMQCPYYIQHALMHALNRNEKQVRVIQTATGGGFGGKEDYPSIIALHAALLAIKGNRPVRLIYDRQEDMAATTKRHPALIRHRTGVDHHGRLLVQDIDVLLDGGAYVTLSPVVLSRSIIHAAGPYHCENVRIQGRVVLTNSVPFGAFRGFGAPQSQFANERQIDRIAHELNIDPVQIRKINLIKDGQTTATNQVINDGADRIQVLDRAIDLAEYHDRKKAHEVFNVQHPTLRRGIGVASFFHGAGFTGSGEVQLASQIHIHGRPDGILEVRSSNVEMGQGALTVFTQIVAERMAYDQDYIVIVAADTSVVPNSGPTVASRTSMIVGKLLEQACDDLSRQLNGESNTDGTALKDAIIRWHHIRPDQELIGKAQYNMPPDIHWNDLTYEGDAYSAFAWSTHIAEVEIDLRTFVIRVINFTAVQEIGKVLNETLARGQIQGGITQAIGWALLEQCHWNNGSMQNNNLSDYVIPTCPDVPPIAVEFLESPTPHGAQGAKGIGELPMNGPAPAILNAIAQATGADPRSIPLTPEQLMETLLT